MTYPQPLETDAQPGELKIDPVLAANLNQLIGPNAMPVDEQVSTLGDMWAKLGEAMPVPAEEQLDAMHWQQDEGWRTQKKVMIFPFDERYSNAHSSMQEWVEAARQSAPGNFVARNALLAPTHVQERAGWKHEVSHVHNGPRAGVRALYKTPEGTVGRSDFLTRMGMEGKVLVGEDGKTWMYAMMDLSPTNFGAEAGTQVGNLHDQVDYALVPEALVAMQLAHKLAGAEGQPITADVTNEMIVFDSEDHPKNKFVTTVGLGADTGRILVSYDHSEASSPHGGYGIRGAGGDYRAPFELAA